MTTAEILRIAALTNLVLIIVLALATTIVRVYRRRRTAAVERELAQLRPVLMQYLATWEDGDARMLGDTLIRHRSHTVSFEELIAGLLPKLRGADRAVLVDILRRRGTIDRACQQSRHWLSMRRALSAELLGSAGAIEGIPYVAKLLDDRTVQVRLAAVRALGRIGTKDAAAVLIAHVDEKNHGIPPQPVTMALLRIGVEAAEPLMAALDSERMNVRTMAAEVLGVLGLIPATTPLEHRLGVDPDVEVRVGAAHALGRLGMPSAVGPLIHSLQTERHAHVLAAVATALGQMSDPSSIPTLELALADAEPMVRIAAAQALIQIGGEGIDRLRSIAQRGAPGADAAREALTHHSIVAGGIPETFAPMPGGPA
jgi:hypothetical protein